MKRTADEDVVLLTGFPSFQAKKMHRVLLNGGETTRLIAVVPKKRLAEAEAILAEYSETDRNRCVLIDGDAASIDLGLSGVEFRALTREVTRIYHCAGLDYHGNDRQVAEHVNVGGTTEILEFARACPRLKCLIFHSSAQVSGDRKGIVREADLQAQQHFRNVIEETQARAEKKVRAAMDTTPIAVIRPGMVVGDSKTGQIDRLEGAYLFILLILTSPPEIALPLPGGGDLPLHIVPVDYVVRAAQAIGRDPRAVGKTFHIVDPAPVTARRAFELVAQLGGRRFPRGTIPANLTRALLRAPGIERFARSPMALLDALITPVAYDSSNTIELLADTDVRCPPFDTYVGKLVEYTQARLRARKEKKKAILEVDDPLE